MKNRSRLLSIIDPIIRTWGSLSIGTRGQFKMGTRGSVCCGISTETSYHGTEGIVIDCTWFNCTAWESDKITCLDQIEKGKAVRVSGRVRVQRYADSEGIERQCWEVMAREVEIIER